MIKIKSVKYISISIFVLILIFVITACEKNENTSATNTKNSSLNLENKNEKSSDDSVKLDTKNDKVEINKTDIKNSNEIKFIKKKLSNNMKINFNTPWQSSGNKEYSASIEGKGEEALEEGQGKIIVKGHNEVYSFELVNNPKKSPKFIEWADNKNLLVIIGESRGTVSKGGNLYILNVDTGKTRILLQTSSNKQQIMSIKKEGNKLSLRVNVYDDDIYNKSHVENWTISEFDPSLNSKMKVEDSNGKLIKKI